MIATSDFPQSFAQELLWLIARASPASSAYNVPRTRLLRGRLDVDALRRAFATIVERHEILRTTYRQDGDRALQTVHSPSPVDIEVTDLRTLPAAQRLAEAKRRARAFAQRPFDLEREFPLRVALLRTDDAQWVLHVDSHHIAADGASRDILFRELDAAYAAHHAGATPQLPPLGFQFADYALWERRYLTGDRLERSLGFWRAELGDVDAALDLVPDVRRSGESPEEAVTRSILIAPERMRAIKALGRRYDATLYMTVLAAYAIVLHLYAREGADVLVGSPVSGRSRPGLDELIGCFVNTNVRRVRFGGDPSFGELLARVRESTLRAYDHQELPLEKLVMDLHGRRAADGTSFVQAVLTVLNPAEGSECRLGDVDVAPLPCGIDATKFDLTLFMSERTDGLSLSLRVRADLWRPATVERFLARVQQVSEAAIADASLPVSRLPLLGDDERAELSKWNGEAAAPGDCTTIVALFDEARARFPERAAVVCGDSDLSYEALGERADRLAQRLRARGAGGDRCIGILLDRSLESIVALLGVAKSGAPYAFLSADAPTARRAQQIGQSGMHVAVTSSTYAPLLPPSVAAVLVDGDAGEAVPERTPGRQSPGPAAEDLVYVVFTSGSTGVPKGVAVTHRSLVHYVRTISRVYAVGVPQDGDHLAALAGWHFAMASTLAADLGNSSLFPALCSGGTLHLLPTEVTHDPALFASYRASHELDVLKITPSHFRALLLDNAPAAAALPSRWLVCGGEALHFDLAETVLAAGRCRLLNHYGPTEATVGATTFEATPASLADARDRGARTVPIGTPLAGVQVAVLDAARQPVPPGVPGELYLGGAGVADGYVCRPDFTAERFVVLDAIGRAYRTGDRVRHLSSGALEYLGRTDAQVKVRGYRIEPGDIEAALRALPDVSDAAVLPLGDADIALAAYVVPSVPVRSEDRLPFADTVRERLTSALPPHMQPSVVVTVDRLPLTANGKLDRRALPALAAPATQRTSAAQPRSNTESALVAIWAETFKRDPATFGIDEDFLALGGHSLLAIRLLGKISRRFATRLALNAIFEHPTIARLAAHIDARIAAGSTDAQGPPLVRAPRTASRRPSETDAAHEQKTS